MNILVVSHDALDPIHRVLYEKLSAFPDVRLRLVVPHRWFDNYHHETFVHAQDIENLDVVPSRVLFSSRTHRLIYCSLPWHVKNFRPDILYLDSEPENFQTFQAAFLNRSHEYGKLIFSSWRNIDYSEIGFPYKFSLLHNRTERYVLGQADHAVAFNKSARSIFERKGFRNVTHIPPAIDTKVFKRDERQYSHNIFTIGFIGRFIEEKGVETLLHAAAELQFDYRLVLVGDGPAKVRWQALASSLGIARNIEWVPPVRRSEIPSILQRMDVVVLPSWSGRFWKEQFGRILIEAMACEVPVIGSDSGEIPDVIADAGVIVPERHADMLARAIIMMRDDESLRRSLVQKGLDRVRKTYSVEVVAQQHYALWRRLLS